MYDTEMRDSILYLHGQRLLHVHSHVVIISLNNARPEVLELRYQIKHAFDQLYLRCVSIRIRCSSSTASTQGLMLDEAWSSSACVMKLDRLRHACRVLLIARLSTTSAIRAKSRPMTRSYAVCQPTRRGTPRPRYSRLLHEHCTYMLTVDSVYR